GRRRSVVWLAAGLAVGYAGFRSISNVTLRRATDPDVQLDRLLTQPWSRPFRLLSAVWTSVAGSWGRAASEVRWDWTSKSSLLSAGLGLLVATLIATAFPRRPVKEPREPTGRPLLALTAAVVAGLIPVAIVAGGWPTPHLYDTRFLLPILVFASC